jgi:hypothetical protein
MGEGSSYLAVPVPKAIAKPPDVAVEGQVPGGVLIPCTPQAGTEIVNRRQYRLVFPYRQGFQLTLRRIHVSLPVGLEEQGLAKQETTTIDSKTYASEALAKKAFESIATQIKLLQESKPNLSSLFKLQEKAFLEGGGESAGYLEADAAYEAGVAEVGRINAEIEALEAEASLSTKTETIENWASDKHYTKVTTTTVKSLVGSTVRSTVTTVTEESVLPINVTVVARLIGPDGELWSDSFSVPMRYYQGNPGAAIGTGTLDAYADLNNGIDLNPAHLYSLALFIFVPTSAATLTHPQLGVEMKGAEAVLGNGEITLLYDIETVPVGK